MKKIIFAFAFLLLMQYSEAFPGKSKIPLEIRNYINLHYPKASKVHWLIHENKYVVSLFNDDVYVEICLNEKGEYVNSLKEILNYDQIPQKIRTKIDLKKLVYAQKLESKDGELFYIFEVSLAKGKIEEQVFDGAGNEIGDHVADENKKDQTEDVLKF